MLFASPVPGRAFSNRDDFPSTGTGRGSLADRRTSASWSSRPFENAAGVAARPPRGVSSAASPTTSGRAKNAAAAAALFLLPLARPGSRRGPAWRRPPSPLAPQSTSTPRGRTDWLGNRDAPASNGIVAGLSLLSVLPHDVPPVCSAARPPRAAVPAARRQRPTHEHPTLHRRSRVSDGPEKSASGIRATTSRRSRTAALLFDHVPDTERLETILHSRAGGK